MFWWYEKNLTKYWRRQADFKTLLIHQATCSTSKNWPIQKPILNTPLQKLNTAVHSLIWNTDNGIKHSKRSCQIFITYFEIKCQYYLQYFQSSIDWYSYSLFKIRNWLFHFCFRFLQRFICLYRNTKILNQESRKFRLFSKRFRFESK